MAASALCKALFMFYCTITCTDHKCGSKILTIGGPAVQRGVRWLDIPKDIGLVKVRVLVIIQRVVGLLI